MTDISVWILTDSIVNDLPNVGRKVIIYTNGTIIISEMIKNIYIRIFEIKFDVVNKKKEKKSFIKAVVIVVLCAFGSHRVCS